MGKTPHDFVRDKHDTIDFLKSIQLVLNQCIEEGMLDEEFHFYNELIDLIDEARLINTYPELAEIIAQAKVLETDVDEWLSMHHRETLSIPWAEIPKL